jgi:hypothetical protein
MIVIASTSTSEFAIESIFAIEVAMFLAKASAAKSTALLVICVSMVSIVGAAVSIITVYFIVGFL